MERFEFGELINLGADCLVFIFLIVYFRLTESPYRILMIPITLVTLSHLFTVLEGVWFATVFNTMEHLSFLSAVLASSFVVYRILKDQSR